MREQKIISKSGAVEYEYKEPRPGELWVVNKPIWLSSYQFEPGDVITMIKIESAEEAAVMWLRDVKCLVQGKLVSSNVREIHSLAKNNDIRPVEGP